MPESSAAVAEPAQVAPPAPPPATPTPDSPPAAASKPDAAPATAAGVALTLDTLKAPEGYAPERIAAFVAQAKAEKLEPAVAQRLIDHEASIVKQAEAAVAEQFKAFEVEAQADPEIGGLKYEKSVAAANAILDRYFPKIAQQMRDEGYTKHPEFLRGLVRLSADMGESLPVKPAGPTTPKRNPVEVNFPVSYAQGFGRESS